MLVTLVIFFVIMTWEGIDVDSSPPRCDSSLNIISKEGILGDIKMFQWLGVIKVHLREEGSLTIALTGIVLIKEGFAIANADDIAKIPKRIFKEDSIAMFIPHDGIPWYCRLMDYLTHPEYKQETLNTIALVELDTENKNVYLLKPICWPSYAYNSTNQLYATGYTDDNKLLEKFLLKLQHVDLTACNEFYSKAGLTGVEVSPTHYQCAFTQDSKENCVWDNGMALISNVSGHWTLIGLGLLGPGCAAPGRFIDLLPYYQWIDSATNLQKDDSYAYYNRRSAFNEDFKPTRTEEMEDIPLHELLCSTNDTLDPEDIVSGKHEFAHFYPFKTVPDSESLFSIKRFNQSMINIRNIKDGHYGDCQISDRVIYKEETRVDAPGGAIKRDGSIRYKLSVYDLYFLNYTCVKIEVVSKYPESAYLYYATEVDQLEGMGYPENPDEVIRVYPIIKHPIGPTAKPTKWKPHGKLKLKMIEESADRYDVYNVNIYIKVNFKESGWFKVAIFGHYVGLPTTIEPITETTTTRPPTSSTRNPYYETVTPKNTSLRIDETDPILNESIRDDDDPLEDQQLLENTYINTTVITPILDWGRQKDDEENDDTRFWNTWKRLNNITYNDQHKTVIVNNQKHKSLVKKLNVVADTKPSNFIIQKQVDNHFGNKFDTQNKYMVSNVRFLEKVKNSVDRHVDKTQIKNHDEVASNKTAIHFGKQLQNIVDKKAPLLDDVAVVEKVKVNSGRRPTVKESTLIAIMLLWIGLTKVV